MPPVAYKLGVQVSHTHPLQHLTQGLGWQAQQHIDITTTFIRVINLVGPQVVGRNQNWGEGGVK